MSTSFTLQYEAGPIGVGDGDSVGVTLGEDCGVGDGDGDGVVGAAVAVCVAGADGDERAAVTGAAQPTIVSTAIASARSGGLNRALPSGPR